METSRKICFHLYVTYQNGQKRTLYVTEGCLLRANSKNRRFARKLVLPFTGKSQKSPFCP
ncbi:vitamin B12-binding protein [Ligilactobacillus ruminis]|nr:vitamin B12-binding protein [Ligilactobacillus ruminis]